MFHFQKAFDCRQNEDSSLRFSHFSKLFQTVKGKDQNPRLPYLYLPMYCPVAYKLGDSKHILVI